MEKRYRTISLIARMVGANTYNGSQVRPANHGHAYLAVGPNEADCTLPTFDLAEPQTVPLSFGPVRELGAGHSFCTGLLKENLRENRVKI